MSCKSLDYLNASSDMGGYGPPDHVKSNPPGMELPPSPLRACPTEETPTHPRVPGSLRTELDSSSVELIEQLKNGFEEGSPSAVFRVRVAGAGERVLKVFHGGDKDGKLRGFIREAKVYYSLFHLGVCASGCVPEYYGWTVIDRTQWNIPGQHDFLLPFRADVEDPRALILEFFPNASTMTLRVSTPQTAINALAGLATIHSAGIVREDIHPRNILVLPNERVIWIDFELGSTGRRRQESRYLEWRLTWSWLYQKLLPWKWYALRRAYSENGRPEDKAELEAIQQVLIGHGAKVYV